VIAGGLSHVCFKVEADNACYFVKRISGEQLETELTLAKIAALNHLTPDIFYHDEQWLISHYIEGKNLAVKKIPLREKITTSIKLMIAFHQLSPSYPEQININKISTLNIVDTIDDLFHPSNQPTLVTEIIQCGHEIAARIAVEMDKPATTIVCCHSDMNFSNVLSGTNGTHINGDIENHKNKGKQNKAWLIDFEYACFAPAEFDLAMLIAINNIPPPFIDSIIDLYEQHTALSLNKDLLNTFILFCYLINGLWYFNSSLDETIRSVIGTKESMQALATEQWQAFDVLYPSHMKQMNRSERTVKLTAKLQAFI
jgi:thiamine kinase-like enzyme